MRQFILLLLCCLLISLCGCGDFWYDVPSEFIDAPMYSAQKKGKGLGHPEDKMLDNIYALKGLPESDYLYRTEGSFWGSDSPTGFLIMNKNAQEPIFRYDVYKIEIKRDKTNFDGSITAAGEPIVIEDAQIIADMISLRLNGSGKYWEDLEIDTDTYYDNPVCFYFDLPCQLIWNSVIFREEDENGDTIIYWKCLDVINDREICYDATGILEGIQNSGST